MTKITLLRHGRSLADDKKKFEGRYNSPLTDTGRDQAAERAGEWAEEGLESVVRRGEGSYLVVSHGGILNATLRVIVGAQPPVNFSGIRFALGDLGYIKLLYNPTNHSWTITAFVPGI